MQNFEINTDAKGCLHGDALRVDTVRLLGTADEPTFLHDSEPDLPLSLLRI